jgi:predicted HD phosphohydrolase
MATVSYTRMADMTESDMELLDADADADAKELPGRLMDAVAALESFQGSLKVSRLEHSLQSATRAHRAGKDKEYVVAALLHDIGDALAPHSHGPLVGAVLRPFVSERICWVVEKHPLFQAYYYAHLMGADRNARDRYRDHPYYDDCVEFCEHFDQNCFDPDFESLPLEFFRPMVEEVFSRPRYLAAGDLDP